MNIVAVHAGAGFQKEDNREAYLKLCERAADAGILSFAKSPSPVDAVVASLVILENDPLTNAGIGSNLCIDGSAECDASIMEGESLGWAGVGALPGIKNPIVVARELLASSKEKPPCGLVPPMLLVGSAAKSWALERHISNEADLMTDKNKRIFSKYKDRIEKSKTGANPNLDSNHEMLNRLDTVGAIAINAEGVSAAGVSSGGVWLKTPGRIGQAATYASGSWAEDGVAVTTSGVGEFIIRTQLAKVIADNIMSSASSGEPLVNTVTSCLEESFTHSKYLRDVDFEDRMAGALILSRDAESGVVEIIASHSTPSMVFAYRTSKMKSPQSFLSRKSENPSSSNSFTSTAFMCG